MKLRTRRYQNGFTGRTIGDNQGEGSVQLHTDGNREITETLLIYAGKPDAKLRINHNRKSHHGK